MAAYLDAARWSSATSADVYHLQAPFRAGVSIENYQLEPLARALLAPRVNLLLAEYVGIGKTVEAGLAANAKIAFQGSVVLGMGFTLEPERARQLIEADPRNAEVLFPYLNGEDLNTRPDGSARRWVINFHDRPEERAASYPAPFAQVATDVKPERRRTNADGNYVLKSPLPQRYWHYAGKRPALVGALEGLRHVIAVTRVSKVVMPVLVPTGQVYSDSLGVFASDDPGLLAVLSSAPHYW